MDKNIFSAIYRLIVRSLLAGLAVWLIGSGQVNAQSQGIVFPHGGEALKVGDTISISWNFDEGTKPAKIVLWSTDAGSWTVLDGMIDPSETSRQWIASEDYIGNQLRIGVTDSAGGVLALCRGYFAVQDSGGPAERPVVRDRKRENTSLVLETYPNPVTGTVHLEWGAPIVGRLEVISTDGTVIRTYPLAEQTEYRLDLGWLPAGSYLAVLRPAEGVPVTTRIVTW